MAMRNKTFFCSVRQKVCKDRTSCTPCPLSASDDRPSAARRGYGSEWRKIRAEVLERAGIPRSEWTRYDVDHRPPYDPAVEPDHRKYRLVPMLHDEHSEKTSTFDTPRIGGKFAKK